MRLGTRDREYHSGSGVAATSDELRAPGGGASSWQILSRLLSHGIENMLVGLTGSGANEMSSRCRVSVNKENRNQTVSAGAYATPADFKRMFTEDVNRLYLLSLLLTGEPKKAETCFVEGIGESTKGNHVFKEWARSWARRTIIKSAIRLIAPRERSVTAIRTGDSEQMMNKVPIVLHEEVSAILGLAPLERFVFVMSVLERYSDNDCSLLLGCARRDIATLRTRAMRQLVTLLVLQSNNPMDADSESVTELTIAQHFASLAWSKSLSL